MWASLFKHENLYLDEHIDLFGLEEWDLHVPLLEQQEKSEVWLYES